MKHAILSLTFEMTVFVDHQFPASLSHLEDFIRYQNKIEKQGGRKLTEQNEWFVHSESTRQILEIALENSRFDEHNADQSTSMLKSIVCVVFLVEFLVHVLIILLIIVLYSINPSFNHY